MDDRWRLFYESDLQGVWLLLVVPALFLLWLAASPGARERARASAPGRFALAYCVLFATLTMVDPVATGPLADALDLGFDAHSRVMIAFVLLGDFRVFALVFGLPRAGGPLRGALLRAALATLVVPAVALSANAVVESLHPELTGQRLWLIYELTFLAMAIVLRQVVVPRVAAGDAALRTTLRAATTYVAVYYALWACSDALILYAGLDAGWLLRMVPNQLYYAFWVPFVWAACSRRR